jgi:hypothetical protein
MPRNAQSFIVETMPRPAPAGAIEIRRGWKEENKHQIMGMVHACPCGCGGYSFMAFEAYGFKEFWGPQPKDGDDFAKMTLTPSIGFMRQPDGSYHWHGYLRNGVFEEC